MKHLWQVIGGTAVVASLFFGTQAYLDARDARTEKIAVRTLESFDRRQQVQTKMHLLEFYEMNRRYATSPQEREKYQRKIDKTKEDISKIGEGK
jgi:hypothetical protein